MADRVIVELTAILLTAIYTGTITPPSINCS